MRKTNLLSPLQQLPTELNRQEMEAILQRIPHLPQAQAPSLWADWRGIILKYLSGLGLVGLSIFGWWQFNHSVPATEVAEITQASQKSPEPGTSNTALLSTLSVKVEDTEESTPTTPIATTTSTPSVVLNPAPAAEPDVPRSSANTPVATPDSRTRTAPINESAPAPSRTYPSPPPSLPQTAVYSPDTAIKKGLFGDYVVKENAYDFSGIPLAKLRRVLRKNLLRDGLISSRQDTVDLYLATSTIYLNGEELMPDKVLIYRKIAEEFQLGAGPMRHVHMTPKGFAVGDFGADYFNGASIGTFRLRVE